MSIQAYDPDYHFIGPVQITEIIISHSAIQLQCKPLASDLVPYMSVPQEGIISLGCTKEQLFEIINLMPKPYEVVKETDEEIWLNPDAGKEEFKLFCTDIEKGRLQSEDNPGIIEIEHQYPTFSRVPNHCLLIGYRPMGKVTDPFDRDQFEELRSNKNYFLIDKVLSHNFIGMHRPFDFNPDFKDDFISPHRDDNILNLLEFYLLMKAKGYPHEDCLQMSCLCHEWFLTLAMDLAKDSPCYEDLMKVGQGTEH